jgi:hypothetical protein
MLPRPVNTAETNLRIALMRQAFLPIRSQLSCVACCRVHRTISFSNAGTSTAVERDRRSARVPFRGQMGRFPKSSQRDAPDENIARLWRHRLVHTSCFAGFDLATHAKNQFERGWVVDITSHPDCRYPREEPGQESWQVDVAKGERCSHRGPSRCELFGNLPICPLKGTLAERLSRSTAVLVPAFEKLIVRCTRQQATQLN